MNVNGKEAVGLRLMYLQGTAEMRESVIVYWEDYEATIPVNLLTAFMDEYPMTGPKGGINLELGEKGMLELLTFVSGNRQVVLSNVKILSLEDWNRSGIGNFRDVAFPGRPVDESIVDYFVTGLPPTTTRNSCLQSGEVVAVEKDPRTGIYKNVYHTFHKTDKPGLWIFDGVCFEGENENRIPYYRWSAFQWAYNKAIQAVHGEDRCMTCKHNVGINFMDCEYCCTGVTDIEDEGRIVTACADYERRDTE